MAGKTTIYHNPKCSKSRQTLALLKERGIEPEIIEYLKTPPTADELEAVIKMLGISARDLMRKKEAAYKELGLDDASISEEKLISAMVENPVLIERPIVLSGKKAAVGRPPENVVGIL